MDEQLRKIAEGREAEIFAWEDGTVLKLMRSPDAQQAVEWQERALRAALSAGVSVPAVHGTTTVDGRPGLIMVRIDGPDMLTLVGKKPWTIFEVATVLGQVHARMHEVRAPEELRNLKDALKGRIESSERVPGEVARQAVEALAGLPDGDRLCHGDFHPGNIIKTDGKPVVIDWTGVMRGDPAADVCRTDLMTRLGDLPPGSPRLLRALALVGRSILRTVYPRAYQRVRSMDKALIERWEVPVAANRLADGIEPERAKLLRILEERRAPSG